MNNSRHGKSLYELFKVLPAEVREAITSEETSGTLREIFKHYNLSSERRAEITDRLLLWLVDPKQSGTFETAIQEHVHDVPRELVAELENKIITTVLKTHDALAAKDNAAESTSEGSGMVGTSNHPTLTDDRNAEQEQKSEPNEARHEESQELQRNGPQHNDPYREPVE